MIWVEKYPPFRSWIGLWKIEIQSFRIPNCWEPNINPFLSSDSVYQITVDSRFRIHWSGNECNIMKNIICIDKGINIVSSMPSVMHSRRQLWICLLIAKNILLLIIFIPNCSLTQMNYDIKVPTIFLKPYKHLRNHLNINKIMLFRLN